MNTFIKKSVAAALAGVLLTQSALTLALTYTQFAYNNTGRLQTVTLPQGQVHTYGYNQAGEVVSYGLPNATSITFGRDGQGGLTSVTDPRGLLTSYTVTGLREMGYRNSPDTGATSYIRNANGQVTSKTDGRGTTTYARDALDRVTSVAYPDTSTTFTYDTPMVGKLGSIQDASGSQGFTYNQRGQLLTRTQYVTDPGGGNKSFGVQNTYDAAGRLSEITYPSGKRVGYTYDGANVSSISVDGTTVISSVTYQPFGGPSSWVMGGAGTFTRAFDTSGRIKTYTFDTGTRTLTWDESNRITAIANPVGGTWSYGYDSLNRVITANEGAVSNRSFAWDASNNRTSTTIAGANYTYGVNGATNRLATATAPSYAASYQYDAMGQIVSDGARNFTWSGAGNLSSVASAQDTTSYLYNGMNQRVRKTTGLKSRYYVYAQDGTSVLGEYWQSAPGTPVGAVSEMVYLEGIPVAVMAGGQTYFVHADHLNTPRIIKNNAGAVVWRWDSDAFGNGLANSNPGGVMQFEFNMRFPGQVYDAESGLYYNNARYYDPVTGRYISSDPIGLAGGINTYGYVEGNPLSLVDPSGLKINLNYFDPREKATYSGTNPNYGDILFNRANAVPDNPNAFTIGGHGRTDNMVDERTGKQLYLSAQDVYADALKAGYVNGKTIIIYSCSTGMSDRGFAAELSKITGGYVVAASTLVNYFPSSYGYAPAPNPDKFAVHPNSISNIIDWFKYGRVFSNGKPQ